MVFPAGRLANGVSWVSYFDGQCLSDFRYNVGPDTIEGDLDEATLIKNRFDQCIDNANNRFTDEPYYASREYDKGQIQVPLLSVANWVSWPPRCTGYCRFLIHIQGGILLHLRGNVIGYSEAGSKNKWRVCSRSSSS